MTEEADANYAAAVHHLGVAMRLASEQMARKDWEAAAHMMHSAIGQGVLQLLMDMGDLRLAIAQDRVRQTEHQVFVYKALEKLVGPDAMDKARVVPEGSAKFNA